MARQRIPNPCQRYLPIYQVGKHANMGNEINTTFQVEGKRGKKPTEDNIHTCYGMEQGEKVQI